MSSGTAEFHRLMKELQQFMQIPPSRQPFNEVYCITIDGKTEVHFLEQQAGSIDMLVHVGTLPNPKFDGALRKLLAMNLFALAGPNISVGMNPQTGAVSLWSRMALATMNVAALTALIELALERAAAVLQCLHEPRLRPPAGGARFNRPGLGRAPLSR
jgi:hypothetical protein